MALKAILKEVLFGTNSKISSVTLVPFNALRSFSSTFLSKFLSLKVNVIGTWGKSSLANSKSIDMPLNFIPMIGTNASGTDAISSTSGLSLKSLSKTVKKSSLVTCFGATTNASISEPGP